MLWNLRWGILIYVDFEPIGYGIFYDAVVFASFLRLRHNLWAHPHTLKITQLQHCTCSHLTFCISHTCAVALPYSGPYFTLHSESNHLDSGMKVTDFNSSLVHST